MRCADSLVVEEEITGYIDNILEGSFSLLKIKKLPPALVVALFYHVSHKRLCKIENLVLFFLNHLTLLNGIYGYIHSDVAFFTAIDYESFLGQKLTPYIEKHYLSTCVPLKDKTLQGDDNPLTYLLDNQLKSKPGYFLKSKEGVTTQYLHLNTKGGVALFDRKKEQFVSFISFNPLIAGR